MKGILSPFGLARNRYLFGLGAVSADRPNRRRQANASAISTEIIQATGLKREPLPIAGPRGVRAKIRQFTGRASQRGNQPYTAPLYRVIRDEAAVGRPCRLHILVPVRSELKFLPAGRERPYEDLKAFAAILTIGDFGTVRRKGRDKR